MVTLAAPHYGVDLSTNNEHPINWAALASYLRQLGGGLEPFIVEKVSQGTAYSNPDVALDIAGAKSETMGLSGYLMDQGNADPASEEAFYKRYCAGLPQLDDDELPEGLTVAQYEAHLHGLIAQAPVALQYLNQSEVQEGFPQGPGLWLAEYNNQPGNTIVPAKMHQFTSSRLIPGCGGAFDVNVWCGTEAEYQELFHQIAPGGNGVGNFPKAIASCLTLDGLGAWTVGTDGGVFSTGDAEFYGSLGGKVLNSPIVDIAVSAGGKGYYLLGADGGVFCFGDAGAAAPYESYPALPVAAREGTRSFGGGSLVVKGPSHYDLIALDGSIYRL